MQSRRMSLIETLTSIAIGFVVSMLVTALVMPHFGFHPSIGENATITSIFTVTSIARGYLVRRFFARFT